MREEDKVLLLYEIMGFDASKFVPKYIEELRCSNNFIHLCKNVAKARNINSFRAQRLIDEFTMIDFYQVKTLKQYFILVSKINYLLANSEALSYLNPFFYNKDNDKISEIGQISINFDQKNYSLNDMILDERYTQKYKISYVKDKYLEWRYEVKDKVIEPLKLLMVKQEKIPNLSYRNSDYLIYLIIIAMINFCFLIAPLLPSHFLLSLYRSTCDIKLAQYIFYLMFYDLIFVDACSIIHLRNLKNSIDKYLISRRILKKSHRIINEVDKKCESLYKYILSGVTDNKFLDDNISKYAINTDYLKASDYLFSIMQNEDNDVSKNNVYSISVVIGNIFLIILFICLIFTYVFYRTVGV